MDMLASLLLSMIGRPGGGGGVILIYCQYFLLKTPLVTKNLRRL